MTNTLAQVDAAYQDYISECRQVENRGRVAAANIQRVNLKRYTLLIKLISMAISSTDDDVRHRTYQNWLSYTADRSTAPYFSHKYIHIGYEAIPSANKDEISMVACVTATYNALANGKSVNIAALRTLIPATYGRGIEAFQGWVVDQMERNERIRNLSFS